MWQITNREALLGDNAIIAVSALLVVWPPRNTNNEAFVFEPAFLLLNTKHKPSSESHGIYVPQAQQNSLQSALHRAAKYMQ